MCARASVRQDNTVITVLSILSIIGIRRSTGSIGSTSTRHGIAVGIGYPYEAAVVEVLREVEALEEHPLPVLLRELASAHAGGEHCVDALPVDFWSDKADSLLVEIDRREAHRSAPVSCRGSAADWTDASSSSAPETITDTFHTYTTYTGTPMETPMSRSEAAGAMPHSSQSTPRNPLQQQPPQMRPGPLAGAASQVAEHASEVPASERSEFLDFVVDLEQIVERETEGHVRAALLRMQLDRTLGRLGADREGKHELAISFLPTEPTGLSFGSATVTFVQPDGQGGAPPPPLAAHACARLRGARLRGLASRHSGVVRKQSGLLLVDTFGLRFADKQGVRVGFRVLSVDGIWLSQGPGNVHGAGSDGLIKQALDRCRWNWRVQPGRAVPNRSLSPAGGVGGCVAQSCSQGLETAQAGAARVQVPAGAAGNPHLLRYGKCTQLTTLTWHMHWQVPTREGCGC